MGTDLPPLFLHDVFSNSSSLQADLKIIRNFCPQPPFSKLQIPVWGQPQCSGCAHFSPPSVSSPGDFSSQSRACSQSQSNLSTSTLKAPSSEHDPGISSLIDWFSAWHPHPRGHSMPSLIPCVLSHYQVSCESSMGSCYSTHLSSWFGLSHVSS